MPSTARTGRSAALPVSERRLALTLGIGCALAILWALAASYYLVFHDEALARFVQTVQSGMSILARDGVGRAELEAVAALAMLGWDARLGASAGGRA